MENLNNNDNRGLCQGSNGNTDMDHLDVLGLSDDDAQERKSSISFDKIKQISLTYSLQSEGEEEEVEDEENSGENNKDDDSPGCNCRRESSCSNCTPAASETNNAARKPSVIEVKKSTAPNGAYIDPGSVRVAPRKSDASQLLAKSGSVVETPRRRGENPSSVLADKDHRTSVRANNINSLRYPQTNPFTRDEGLDYDHIDGDDPIRSNIRMGSPSSAATTTINNSTPSNHMPFEAGGGQEAGVYQDWPALKQHTRLDRQYIDSDHTPTRKQSLSTSSRSTTKQDEELAESFHHSPRRGIQLIGSPRARKSNYRTPIGTNGANLAHLERGYPDSVQIPNGTDNSTLGLRLRQHNNSILSLVVYNESDVNVMVSEDPESCSDESYWGSAAIGTEPAMIGGHHNENIEYSSEDEILEDHNHQLILQNRNLNKNGTSRIRDANNAKAAENDRGPKQTPLPQQQRPSYPIQRPSNRRVESLSQHDLENQAGRRSVGAQYDSTTRLRTGTNNGYHRVDSESMDHLNQARRQPMDDLERNLQAANYRQHSGASSSSQTRDGISKRDFEGRLFSPIRLNESIGATIGRADAGFENIRSTINDYDETQFPPSSRAVRYQGTACNQLLSSEGRGIDNVGTQDQLNYFVHSVSEEPRTSRQRSKQNSGSISGSYTTVTNQALGQAQQRPIMVDDTAYAKANIVDNIYRDYQSRPIGQPQLRNSSVLDEERQEQLHNERHSVRDYEATHEGYSPYTSPGGRRRQKSHSNDPTRNPFRDDNHRINIVVSSPQRYVRPKRRPDSVPKRLPILSSFGETTKLRQSELPQHRSTGFAGRSAGSAWVNHGVPLVDHWQQSSPSSICSQSGWSVAGGGYMQESLDRTSANQVQRTSHMPGHSSTGGGNPGDKLTQLYQSEHSRDPNPLTSIDKRQGIGRDESRSDLTEVDANLEAGISRQYAEAPASNSASTIGERTSNQYERKTTVTGRYASSGFETADSNSELRSNSNYNKSKSSKSEAKNETSSRSESARGQQPPSPTPIMAAPSSGSGCPLFAGRGLPERSTGRQKALMDDQRIQRQHHNSKLAMACAGSRIQPQSTS